MTTTSQAPLDAGVPPGVVERSPEQIARAARGLAAIRGMFGAALLLAPTVTGRLWLGGADSRGRHRLVQAIGARDVVLASGTLLASRPRRWLVASAVADAADALASTAFTIRTHRLRSLGTAALAVGGAVAGGRLAAAAD